MPDSPHARKPATDPLERLRELGLELPPVRPPVGNYTPAVQEGSLVFLSGQGPVSADMVHRGKVGAEVSIAEAYEHARLTALNLLAVLQDHLGSLKRVRRIVKVFGMVNAAPDFQAHPAVIDGCSDLLVALFGDAGKHARSAVGMGSLPGLITVEIELVVAVDDAD